MVSPNTIKKLVDSLFISNGVYPEKFIANISKDNFNLPVLRMLSRLVDNYPSNPSILVERAIEEFPDIYKANTERLLGIEPRFDIPDFNKNQTMREAINRLKRWDEDVYKDYPYSVKQYVKNIINNRDTAETIGMFDIIKHLSGGDMKKALTVNGGSDMVRQSIYDLFKEIATLRNPQGLTVYRDPNYMIGNPIVKRSGILSFTKDPDALAKMKSLGGLSNVKFNNVVSYNLKPRSIVADFSKTPFGYPFENEVQAIISKTRKPDGYFGNFFTALNRISNE